MPTTTIETEKSTFTVQAPAVTIYTADVLDDDEFEEVKYLRLNKLRITAAPDIDTCEMQYEFGNILRPGKAKIEKFTPLSITDKFVKVVIAAAVDDEDEIVWYGKIKAVSSRAFGGGSDGKTSCGIQSIIAFGLLILLDEVQVDKSYVDDGDDDTIEIKEALPFNLDPGGAFPVSGNRSLSKIDGCYVFSKEPRTPEKWSALTAVEYLLKHFSPLDSDDAVANVWEIYATTEDKLSLQWYEISLNPELRTVKQVIDALIDRRRGMSYRVEFHASDGKIWLRPFSFASENVTLPSGQKLYANGSQRRLNFEQAVDVTEAIISDMATARYHRVRAYGEFMTSTFTVPLYGDGTANDMFEKDWSSAEEAAYIAGASADAEYASQDDTTKQRWNALARNSDKFKNVFSRWRVRSDWSQFIQALHDPEADTYNVAPIIGEPDEDIDPSGLLESEPLWLRGLNILRHLPLRDRYDYSGTKISDGTFAGAYSSSEQPGYLPLMVYARVEGDEDVVRDDEGALIESPARFDHVERLSYTAFDSVSGFNWSCSVGIPDTIAGLEINAHPAQMIAKAEWAGASPAATPESQDPTASNGIDWKNIFVTLTMEIPKRVQSVAEIESPASGAPVNELAIHVPRARVDYVLPYTTVRIENGIPIASTSGGTIQDDRERVADIARAAAEWYGADRKTLQLTFKQVRDLFRVGWLITDIGATFGTSIKTPITAIEYTFPEGQAAPTTKIETAFAALDFT